MKTIMRGAAILLGLAVAGCGGGGEKPASKEAEKAKTTSEASRKTEVSKGPYVTKFRLGYGVGPDRIVTVDGGVFAKGETAYTSFEVPNAPADSKIRIVWNLQPENKAVAEEEVPAGEVYSLKADTKGWPLGEYRLQIYISSATLNVQNQGLGTAGLKLVQDRPK